jgi:hypothetical protein
MKLSDHIQAIDTAFAILMASLDDNTMEQQEHRHHHGTRIR